MLSILLALATIIGCGGQSRNQKINDIHIGMTVQEVEDVVGEPLDVFPGAVSTHEIRMYKGDGKDTIGVTFEKGVVKSVRLHKWKLRLTTRFRPSRWAVEECNLYASGPYGCLAHNLLAWWP